MKQNYAVHAVGKGLQLFLNILFFFIFIFSLIQTFSLPAIKEAGAVFWLIILSGFTAVFFAALHVYSSPGKNGGKISWKSSLIPGIALLGIFSLILSFCTFLVSLFSSKDVNSLITTNPFLIITMDTSNKLQNSAAEHIAGWLVHGSLLVLTGISIALLCAFLWFVLTGSKVMTGKSYN